MNISKIRENIVSEYRYRIELHAHTKPMSLCCGVYAEELVELYHQKGYDGIVITNHFNNYSLNKKEGLDKEGYIDAFLKDFADAEKLAEKYGMTIYLGCELKFDENDNDYLIYGVNREILDKCFDYMGQDIVTFRKEVSLPDSVFLHAHPFRNTVNLVDPTLLDGIEILNVHPWFNQIPSKTIQYAYENNLKIKTAGSDFHAPDHVAGSALRAKFIPKDSFELAELLRSGDYVLEIGENVIVLP